MTTSKGIRAKDYPSQFSSVADTINLESKIVIGVSYEIQSQILYGEGVAQITGLLIFSLLLILLSSCRQTILLPLPDPDAGNGEIASGIKIDVEGTEITATINEEGKAVLDLSQAVSEKEEIATIKDENGDTIYDVNYPDNTKDGYTYDSTNNTLTIDNIDDLSGGLSITTEKVKVLLYDAKLAIDGRKYSATLSNPIGKYSKPSEAYAAVSEDTFSKGIYIKLQSDIEKDSLLEVSVSSLPMTVDLNGKTWSDGKPDTYENYPRMIHATVSSGAEINVINGTLCDNTLLDDQLGAAIYVSNSFDGSISDWLSGNKDTWGTVNIFDVVFSNNYADGGGAICINGAIELNVYDSKFEKNKSKDSKQTGNNAETGSGSAIYIWSSSRQGEIVNLYDCTFTGNDGDGMLSVESGNADVLFNIYGGDFTNNKLYKAPLMSIYSFNIYGGNFSVGKLSNDTGSSNLISINGGIIDTLDIKGSNTLTLSGGSIGILEAEIFHNYACLCKTS